jgi:RimJ/RimL family protein N-acetyltransferase
MTPPARLLYGERVRLTALNQGDVPIIARWYRDTVLLRLFDAVAARPQSEAQIARRLEKWEQDENGFYFAIRSLDESDEDLLGLIELDGVIWPHGVCGISIAIGDPADWGQGYGYEASELALAFAFQELNLHRVTATVFSYNDRSRALFEKLGFRREGAFREFLERDGERHDMLLYGLLRPEWEARRQRE